MARPALHRKMGNIELHGARQVRHVFGAESERRASAKAAQPDGHCNRCSQHICECECQDDDCALWKGLYPVGSIVHRYDGAAPVEVSGHGHGGLRFGGNDVDNDPAEFVRMDRCPSCKPNDRLHASFCGHAKPGTPAAGLTVPKAEALPEGWARDHDVWPGVVRYLHAASGARVVQVGEAGPLARKGEWGAFPPGAKVSANFRSTRDDAMACAIEGWKQQPPQSLAERFPIKCRVRNGPDAGQLEAVVIGYCNNDFELRVRIVRESTSSPLTIGTELDWFTGPLLRIDEPSIADRGDPRTCELRVGDRVRYVGSAKDYVGEMLTVITGGLLRDKGGAVGALKRSNLELVEAAPS